MGIWSRLLNRTAPAPQAVRRFDAAGGGRRASGFGHFGATGPETLAAAPSLRSRARHAYANQGFIRNAVEALVAETVGAGIKATSAHPDPALRPLIDAAFARHARVIDAEGRTDLARANGRHGESCVVDGEAFV